MSDLHPAIALLVLTGICLTSGLPLILWFGLGDRREANARLWYGGLGALAVAVIAVGVLQSASWISGSALTLSSLLCIEAIRREAGLVLVGPRRMALFFALFAAAELAIDLTGYRLTAGVLLTNASTTLLDGYLIVLLFRVGRAQGSRGLLVALIGVFPPWLVAFGRSIYVAATGAADNMFSYSVLTNAALFAVTFGSVLKTIGYMIFSLEKAHRRHLADALEMAGVNERRQAAEDQAAAMQALVIQRDQMIMISSRFSAVSSLALFNSAVVHEISQPLQALVSALDVLRLRAMKPGEDLREGLGEARELASKMGLTVATLRKLIAHRETGQALLPVADVVDDIATIARATASRKGVVLDRVDGAGARAWRVWADRVLLERVLLNLVANALDALADGDATPRIVIGLDVDRAGAADVVVISVRDNGPGVPERIVAQGPTILHTTKHHGVGLGLALARIIVENWKGQLNVGNWADADGSGACIEIRLPLAG